VRIVYEITASRGVKQFQEKDLEHVCIDWLARVIVGEEQIQRRDNRGPILP
jgi:hypothetical protein